MCKKFGFDKKIKLVISDFDGIFTDGSVYVSEDMKLSKKISFKDIMGISVLLKAGYEFAIISGEKTPAIDYLKETFPSIEIFQKIRDKLTVMEEYLIKKNIKPNETVYIGDDINDIKCLDFVKYKISVPNANQKVKKVKKIKITKNFGGNGAFREVADELAKL